MNPLNFAMNLYSEHRYWTHVKEIPNTKLLISLQHSYQKCAKFKMFDISKKGVAKTVYTFEEVLGGKTYILKYMSHK